MRQEGGKSYGLFSSKKKKGETSVFKLEREDIKARTTITPRKGGKGKFRRRGCETTTRKKKDVLRMERRVVPPVTGGNKVRKKKERGKEGSARTVREGGSHEKGGPKGRKEFPSEKRDVRERIRGGKGYEHFANCKGVSTQEKSGGTGKKTPFWGERRRSL